MLLFNVAINVALLSSLFVVLQAKVRKLTMQRLAV